MDELKETELDNVTAGYNNRELEIQMEINRLKSELTLTEDEFERNAIYEQINKLEEELSAFFSKNNQNFIK